MLAVFLKQYQKTSNAPIYKLQNPQLFIILFIIGIKIASLTMATVIWFTYLLFLAYTRTIFLWHLRMH